MSVKVNEFLNLPEFNQSIGGNETLLSKLRKFSAKSSILNDDVTDAKIVDRKIMTAGSWSWLGFLFNMYWLIYYNAKYSWILLFGYLGVMVLSDAMGLPLSDGPLPIVVAAFGGVRGFNFLLWSRLEEARSGAIVSKPSAKRALAALGITIIVTATSTFLFSNGGPTPHLSLSQLSCSDLSVDVEQMILKNGLGGEWKIFSTSNWREISRTNAMLVCNTNAVTEAGEGQYRVEVTVKNGQLFIQVLPI